MISPAPQPGEFEHIHDWVFDLDNTLYPHHSNLFAQIDERMTKYVSDLLKLPHDEARTVQKDFYKRYGTTLKGLIENHGVDPDHFLETVHDIDYSRLLPDPSLGDAIKALPGRKFIFTNGDRKHAERTARALGVLDHFDDIFDVVAAELVPKPAAETYDKFLELHRVDCAHAVMFEDLARNLIVPKTLGMTTVLIVPHNFEPDFTEIWENEHDGEHIDHVTDDLAGFLQMIGDQLR